jgi:hypothetical protein
LSGLLRVKVSYYMLGIYIQTFLVIQI